MVEQTKTKEERYILKAYEMALASGDISLELERYEIGEALGYSYRTVNAMCNTLLQANFFKKTDETTLQLTSRGIELAKRFHKGC